MTREQAGAAAIVSGQPSGVAASAEAIAAAVVSAAESAPLFSDDQLVRTTGDLLALVQFAETATVALVAEAITRGLIEESTAADPRQWVLRLAAGERAQHLLPATARSPRGPLVPLDDVREDPGATTGAGLAAAEEHDHEHEGVAMIAASIRRPGLEPAQATRIAAVAQACCSPEHAVLARAVRSSAVGVPAARTALLEAPKVLAVLPAATHDEVYGHFLQLPPGSGARPIRALSERVIATYADENHLRQVDELTDAVETVGWTALPNGMARLTADLAPAHAHRVRHALDALSRPSPANSCCDNVFHRHDKGEPSGDRDERRPAKRRADALMLLIGAGAAAIDADGTTAKSGSARVVVTVGLDVLTDRLRGSACGEDLTVLTAAQARRLACDADVLPMVLGSRSEPLDVGREQRLVKPGLRAAVAQRDRHCTFPECDRPPSWCEVHHVVPWHAGGPTSLENSALLCVRHHTTVHRYGYAAHVDGELVSWDLRPGRMSHRPADDSHAASRMEDGQEDAEPP